MQHTAVVGKKQYNAIDCAKLFFCLCIIALHCGAQTILPGDMPYLLEKVFFRVSVPFFFVSSGFFLAKSAKKYSEPRRAFEKYVRRLLFPFIVFGIGNTILEIIKMAIKGMDACFIVSDVVRHVLFYQYGALWYVGACIVGALLLYPFFKKRRINSALFVGAFLYMFALIVNNYYFFAVPFPNFRNLLDGYMQVFVSGRNGLFVGFFFLALGIKTEEIENSETNLKIEKCGILLLFSAIFYVMEIFFIRSKPTMDDGALYISHVFLIPLLILFLSKLKCTLGQRQTVIFRQLSVGMYFIHKIILSSIEIIDNLYQVFKGNVVLKTCIVVTVSLVVCLLVRLKKNTMIYKLLS